jgi:hypothetical protein
VEDRRSDRRIDHDGGVDRLGHPSVLMTLTLASM